MRHNKGEHIEDESRERERDRAQYCVKGVMILVVPTDPRLAN